MKPTNLLIALVFLLIPWTTKAQVIPDKTLLTEVDSEFNITGGQTIRENLFHSFEQFSPSAGTRVTFHQSQFIKNIFTRVTGSSPSLINGEINILAGEEIGKANLFLINPNGIIFGSGAALNIGGSFFGTTAQGVIFDDGSIFSANPSATSSLLNVRVPIGLVFSEAARAIKVETNPDIPLEVPFEKTLALVGGEIKITQRTLKAPQGQIQIASVGEGIVNITEASGGGWKFDYSQVNSWQDIQLNESTIITTPLDSQLETPIQSIIELSGRKVKLYKSKIQSSSLAENQPPSNIHIRAIENVDLKNTSQVSANTFSSRDAGRIVIETSQLELDGNSRLEATAEEGASGNGGEILINASRFIKLSQGSIINALTDGAGPGGTIIIHSSQLSVDTGAAIVAQTFAEGQGGDIKINVINLDVNGIDKDMVNRSAILINSSGEIDEDVGDGGTLEIRAKTLQVSDGGLISVGTRTRGDAGNIVLQVSDFIKVRGIATVIDSEINENGIEQIKPSAISSSSRNAGDAGNLEIKTSILQVLDGGIIESSTTNIGQGGLIDITADNLEINGRNGDRVSRISSQSQASTGISKGGDAGIIRINTQNLSIVNGGTISLETNNTGKGGNLFLNVVGNLQVRGSSINTNNQIDPSSISSSSQGAGDAGNLQIKASNLQILDGATIESATQNIGQGGLIDITADNLEINGRNGDRVSRISSQSQASTGLSKGGDAGIIRINTQNLSIGDGGAISLDTNTTGKGGNLFLNAAETVQVTENSSISSSSSGAGTAGNLDIKTGILRVLDGATIESATQNIGQGGLIDITADNLEINGISSAISSQSQASTGLSKGGNAGIIRINTQNLSIGDGGTISLETNTTGKGGNLFLNAAETVQVTENSSISSSSSGAGTAGNLDIKTGNLFVLDGGTIKASATNTSQAGNISINARTIRLEDKGKIRTDNKNLDGGNITLRASEILTLRRGGGISTNAGADGGNIKIDTPFILGVREENSDITANADAGGRGGNIKIKTQSIFGLERREKTTDFSDITASSAFGTPGIININNSAIEAQEVPPELPQEPLDAALLIDQALCSVGRTNELTVSGRGGLPSTPEQVISGNQPWEDWRSGTQTSQEQTPRTTVKETPRQLPLREFQGWTVNARGNIVLTAQANMITPQGDWIPPLGCQNLR